MPAYYYEFDCTHREPLPDRRPDNPEQIHVDESVTRRIDVSRLKCPACQDEEDDSVYSSAESIRYTKIVPTEYTCGHCLNELQSEEKWESDVHDKANQNVEEIVFLREGGCGTCMKTKGKGQGSGAGARRK